MEKHSRGIEGYIRDLDQMIEENKAGKDGRKGKALAGESICLLLGMIIADSEGLLVGECGLDYDRLFLAPKEAQLK